MNCYKLIESMVFLRQSILSYKVLHATFCLFSISLAGCIEEDPVDIEIPQQTTNSITSTKLNRVVSTFSPSLGINTEAPQPESGISGEAIPFVDLFRTARPFQELSTGITVDQDGWPTSIAPDGVARTYLMQTVPVGSIPYGDYTLLYEGTGQVEFGSSVTVQPLAAALIAQGYQGRTITIDASTQGINISVSGISAGAGNYVKNIRLIMPGGTCGSLSHIRVDDASTCPDDQPYESFVDKLKDNRNAIVFNPDYLNFMKDFNTVRMMNLLAASPGRSSCNDGLGSGGLIYSCIVNPITWAERAQLQHAAWGGSGKTSLAAEHYVTNPVARNGVPVEVVIELANQLDVNPWINIHHAADDGFVTHFAEYAYQHLNKGLRVYLEYSNEVWNSGFIGFHYAQIKGIEHGLNYVPVGFPGSVYRDENYFARLHYYSKRSVEIFDLWEAEFGNKNRLVRVLAGFQGDTILSEKILEFEDAAKNNKVDALSIAPYFSGCIVASFTCASAPLLLPDAQTVDDVFAVIDWEPSPNGLQGILRQIEKHVDIANENGVHLVAYEGGQNLVVTGAFPTLPDPEEDALEKERLRNLFFAANRDFRMKERYLQLLNGWHAMSDKGTALFALYTQPQSYYHYGSWGIKEHLNQSRFNAPKYDAALTFQETVERPWWDYEREIKAALSIIMNLLILDEE